MARKVKIILIISLAGLALIGVIGYNVVQLMNTLSDNDEQQQSSSNIVFSLTSDTDTPTEEREIQDKPKSDYEELRNKQRNYTQGQAELSKPINNQPVMSFSSIFQEQPQQTQQPAHNATRSNTIDDELQTLLPSREELKPRLTTQTRTNSTYDDLEEDIQSFYGSGSSSKSTKPQKKHQEEEQPSSPESELQKRRRALQNGFTINQQETSSMATAIKAAIHGNQEVITGQSIKVRVLEGCIYNGIEIPRNTILDAQVSVSRNRLALRVNAIQVKGQSYNVNLQGYDMYGQVGLPLTVDKAKNIGSEEITDAIEDVADDAIGRTTIGKIITGSFSSLRKEKERTIIVLDAQKLYLK